MKYLILILIIVVGVGAGYGVWWGFGGSLEWLIAGAALGAIVTVAIVTWLQVWRHKTYRADIGKYMALVLILVIAGGALFWLLQIYPSESPGDHPTFEITAVNALPGDNHAFELNDNLIWEQDNLAVCRRERLPFELDLQ